MSVGFELDPVTGEQGKPVAPPVGLLWAAAIALLAGAVLLAAHLGTSGSQPHLDLPGYVLNGLITVGLVASFRRVDAGRPARAAGSTCGPGRPGAGQLHPRVEPAAAAHARRRVGQSGQDRPIQPARGRAKAALSELVELGDDGRRPTVEVQLAGFSEDFNAAPG
jgi:hypothetical protein